MRHIVRAPGLLLVAAFLATAPVLAQESPTAPQSPQPAVEARATADDADALASVVLQLSAENRKKFGQMLATDWTDRPGWADMLIALLNGERMQPPAGWYGPSERKFDYGWLCQTFDANGDKVIDKEELPADTPQLELIFARLDRDADGKLQLQDFDYDGGRQASLPQTVSQFLFSVLDGDSNGRVTAEELSEFFSRGDQEQAGFLTAEDLLATFSSELAARNNREDMPDAEQMLKLFFRGELGTWEPGPKLGDKAPDFTLPTHDGSRTVTLSECRGKPVILIFGSFT